MFSREKNIKYVLNNYGFRSTTTLSDQLAETVPRRARYSGKINCKSRTTEQ